MSSVTDLMVHCSGTNLTMEDRLVWADTVASHVLLESGIDERILEMWGHLKKAAVYFLRYQPGQHQEHYIDEAQEELFQYARLVQWYFGGNELLTYQLHACMAHVAAQARHSGPTAFAGEWWLERCMQVFKRITKYRSTRHPECVGTNHFLAVQALDKIAYSHPRATYLLDAIGACSAARGRDDTTGSEWLVGTCEDVSDRHAEVRGGHARPFWYSGGTGLQLVCTYADFRVCAGAKTEESYAVHSGECRWGRTGAVFCSGRTPGS